MTSSIDGKTLCTLSLHMMAAGDLAHCRAIYDVDARNREGFAEPPEARGSGPAAFYATALWLRSAFSQWRVRNGKIAEHWANRDDLGMGEQLGWTPPTPLYLARAPRPSTGATSHTHLMGALAATHCGDTDIRWSESE
jgi:hypothetical protein